MATIAISANLIWGILSILFGLLILAAPKLLNYLVALYLILVGVLMIIGLVVV